MTAKKPLSMTVDARDARCRRAAGRLGIRVYSTTRRACPGYVLESWTSGVIVEGLTLFQLEVVLEQCKAELRTIAAGRRFARSLVGPRGEIKLPDLHRLVTSLDRLVSVEMSADVRQAAVRAAGLEEELLSF